MSPFLLLFLISNSLAEESLITPSNASSTVIRCPVAENFIQTHMAPDFESPQLVRRLDWFHDEALVASYTQNIVSDTARQWWVSDSRFQLQRPFYSLRLSPVLPDDSGIYRCRLETDPLFTLSSTTSHMELNVMVRPSPPSSPEIKNVTNRAVTLAWNHSTARAHRPILRYSVGVRSLADGSRFVIPAPSNATSVIVDNLSAFASYAFAVRAENGAGLSEFGPETVQRTLGEAPSHPPRIIAVTNASDGCVAVTVEPPMEMHGQLMAILVSLAGEGVRPAHEKFGQGAGPLTICGLQPHTAYTISIIAESEFGTSPPAQHNFNTDLAVPQTAPRNVAVKAMVGSNKLIVHFGPPDRSQDIVHYNIYYKALGQLKWKVERLPIAKVKGVPVKYEINNLAPRTSYSVRVSASSSKGEGPRSSELTAATDTTIPAAVEIERVSYDCHDGVQVEWTAIPGRPSYKVEIGNTTNTMVFNTTKTSLEVSHLLLHQEYTLRIAAVHRSLVDNITILQGLWGMEQRFILSSGCNYHSSLCSSTSKCQPLVAAVQSRNYSLILFIAMIGCFLVLCVFVFLFIKGRCVDVKYLLKKKEKCVYLDELAPLVYDSAGFEDIPVELFYGYCEDLARNNNAKYKLQFEQIEQLTCPPLAETIVEENSDKNRYLNIGAIESSRVRLLSSESDYINASWIDSCSKKKTYIATQAPLPCTFGDFWAMVWQERCNVIVVITNLVEDGRRKCDPYWPLSPDCPQTHAGYQISLVSETSNAYFCHRVLSLRIAKCVPPTERRVHQIQFTAWPDHGVPQSVFPLLNFMHYVSDIHTTGPIVVHCSAGVGRSGSFILVDSMRRHLTSQRKLNLMGHLVHMRRQREKLVQTLEQYMFCHEAVRQLIRHGITRVHSDLFQRYLDYLGEENNSGKTRIQMQYDDLCRCAHRPTCSPPEEFIVLPGYHRQDEFLVASWPQENEKLWELVWQRNCQTIVLLGDGNSYWTRIDKIGEMTVTHGEHFVILQNNEDQLYTKIVSISPSVLETHFWEEVERLQKERLVYHDAPLLILNPLQKVQTTSSLQRDGGIVTTVANGPLSQTLSLPCLIPTSSPSLAFCVCALTSLACQLETSGCLDVVSTISSYHRLHCGIWQSFHDIEFVYDQLITLVAGSRV